MAALPLPPTYATTLPDGRLLAWVDLGDASGTPVLAMHGLPGSRFQRHPDESIPRDLGVRVLHLERPGFGRSSVRRGRRLRDWPEDVAHLADALGLGRFAIVGVSGGGPYALACASMLGERVTRTAVVSGVGPRGSMQGPMPWTARVGLRLAPYAAWVLAPPVAVMAWYARRNPLRYLDRVAAAMPPVDRSVLARPAVRGMFAQDMSAAYSQGHRGFLDDLRLIAGNWKLSLESIRCPVAFWHGTADALVPDGASRALAAAIPGSALHLFEGAGHFCVFDCWAEVLRWLKGEAAPVAGP
ncbi:MAG TPA: alpha/beta hydrolase [Burkholderiales bacterium]|nr:alpha/beta hydrolase [Burkholderiales bacterium]